MIDFYYWPTPNGWKVSIMLEECGIDYRMIPLNISKGEQFAPDFLTISPNNRMPAIVDDDPPSEYAGEPVKIFESGAILLHLARKTGKFMATDPVGEKETLEWLFWQVGNLGPMAGQISHFVNYAPEGQDYGRKRYLGEYDRNLGVLDARLEGRTWLVGDDYSIADMIAFPWVFIAKPLTASLDAFPNVAAWRQRIKDRPAVQRAIALHKRDPNRQRDTAATNSLLFNQSSEHLRRARTKT